MAAWILLAAWLLTSAVALMNANVASKWKSQANANHRLLKEAQRRAELERAGRLAVIRHSKPKGQ